MSRRAAGSVHASPRPIVPLLRYQRRAVESPARFTWNNWSRQIGKSFAFALRRLLRGLERRRLQVLLSAGERQSRELMLKVQQHCQALQIAAELRSDTFFEGTGFKQLELSLPNGVRVLALPANPQTARGFTGDALLDEFAMHADDRAIWAALFPTVTRGRGELDIASTPAGKGNVFFRLSENDAFEHSTVTIHDAVRDGLDVDVDEIRTAIADEELWRQEFECEFVDEATAFLTYEQIARCQDPRLAPPLRLSPDVPAADRPGLVAAAIADVRSSVSPQRVASGDLSPQSLFAGLDLGRRRDRTVAWVLAPDGPSLVTVAVIEMDRLSFREQREALEPVFASPSLRRMAIDATGLGMQFAEEAQRRLGEWIVDAVTFSAGIKQKLAGQLRLRVEDGSIRIPVDAAVREDFHAIERHVTTGGAVLYRAERTRDGHADRFWAAALAIDAARQNAGVLCEVI